MPITIEHGRPKTLAKAAVLAGQAQAQQQERAYAERRGLQAQQLAASAEQQERSLQAGMYRQLAAQEADLVRQQQGIQGDLFRTAMLGQQQAEREAMRHFQGMEELGFRSGLANAEWQFKEAHKGWEYALSHEDQKQIGLLHENISKVYNDPTLRPEQKAEAIFGMQQQMAGIQPQWVRKSMQGPPPGSPEWYEENVIPFNPQRPELGSLVRQPDGGWKYEQPPKENPSTVSPNVQAQVEGRRVDELMKSFITEDLATGKKGFDAAGFAAALQELKKAGLLGGGGMPLQLPQNQASPGTAKGAGGLPSGWKVTVK